MSLFLADLPDSLLQAIIHNVSKTPCGTQIPRKKDDRWGSPEFIWPTPAQSRASFKVTLSFSGLCPAESCPPLRMEASQPLWAPFQFLTSLAIRYFFLISSHVSCVQLCLLPLITQHLSLNVCRKLLGPQKANSTPSWPSPAPSAPSYRASAPVPPPWTSPLNSLQPTNIFLHCRPETGHRCNLRSAKKRGGKHLPQFASARACELWEEETNFQR